MSIPSDTHPEMARKQIELQIEFVRLYYGADLAERLKRYLEERDR